MKENADLLLRLNQTCEELLWLYLALCVICIVAVFLVGGLMRKVHFLDFRLRHLERLLFEQKPADEPWASDPDAWRHGHDLEEK